jgi:hypothetical protein
MGAVDVDVVILVIFGTLFPSSTCCGSIFVVGIQLFLSGGYVCDPDFEPETTSTPAIDDMVVPPPLFPIKEDVLFVVVEVVVGTKDCRLV